MMYVILPLAFVSIVCLFVKLTIDYRKEIASIDRMIASNQLRMDELTEQYKALVQAFLNKRKSVCDWRKEGF